MSKPTIASYIVGFVVSVVLTLTAYFTTLDPAAFHLGVGSLVVVILSLAVVQLVVQLVFFLHLGKGSGSRWNVVILFSTIGIIFIIITGSLWIMSHLNYNMTPQEINQYIIDQSG